MRRIVEAVGILLALLVLAFLATRCTPKDVEPVVPALENAAAVAQYKALTDACRAKGKDAGSYAVYDACADDVDQMVCRASGMLCQDGGR